MTNYDWNASGKINNEEIFNFAADLYYELGWPMPSQEEIQWLLESVDTN